MINKIKNIFKRDKQKWHLFGSSEKELEEFFCELGEIKIYEHYIEIKKYPFEPSIAFKQEKLDPSLISEIYLDSTPPMIRINKDLVFLSAKYGDELKIFAKNNSIRITHNSDNWRHILTPFLDTEYDDDYKISINKMLIKNGISEEEITILRNEVEEQMLKYNFDTMLWEWCFLDLFDVLCAMKVKYNLEEFRDFYNRAIEIELRKARAIESCASE